MKSASKQAACEAQDDIAHAFLFRCNAPSYAEQLR